MQKTLAHVVEPREKSIMNPTSWHSYPKIYNFGHRVLKGFLEQPVLVQEKVDGSQFSFGLFPGNEDFPSGYRARSKGAVLHLEAPEKMFAKACEVIQTLPLREGWTYRGEYLSKPKHNSLAYDRVPRGHIILFDINIGEETYLRPEELKEEADRIGLECVPVFFEGFIRNPEEFREMLEEVSVLGGQKIEGVVAKNYDMFGPDKKVVMAKFVSEAFKEIHGKEWKNSNPSQGDVVQKLITKYKTAARWSKAVQHLREAGKIQDSPADIGALIKEVHEDIPAECEQEIKDELYKLALPAILRGCTSGLPQWYKEELLKKQFETEVTT